MNSQKGGYADFTLSDRLFPLLNVCDKKAGHDESSLLQTVTEKVKKQIFLWNDSITKKKKKPQLDKILFSNTIKTHFTKGKIIKGQRIIDDFVWLYVSSCTFRYN